MTRINDWMLIRKALIDELEAVNYYEDFMQRLESQEAIKVMDHINLEEKEHVAELTELLRLLDPGQAGKLQEELHGGLQEMISSGLEEGAVAKELGLKAGQSGPSRWIGPLKEENKP